MKMFLIGIALYILVSNLITEPIVEKYFSSQSDGAKFGIEMLLEVVILVVLYILIEWWLAKPTSNRF